MSQRHTLFVLIATTFLLSSHCISDQVLRVVEEKEKLVQRIAARSVELFQLRASSISTCNCSVHTCSFEPFAEGCHTELGTVATCGADCHGQHLNYNSTVVFTPPGTNPQDLGDQMKESICTYRSLESMFTELYPKVFLWTYMATTDGHFRLFPAVGRDHTQEENVEVHGCRDYDPRGRPWYIAASTGPKDIVFVIDGYGSMLNDPPIAGLPLKWDTTKNAVLSMLNTLSTGDFTNIVVFSDAATQLWTRSNLVVASTENKEEMMRLLDNVTPKGGTNFDAAFELAFSLLTNACSAEERTCSNCEKVIIFLTDGKDTSRSLDGGIKPSEMAANIAGYQDKLHKATSRRASIFTFSMGSDADDSIPRQIACNNDGSWAFIKDTDDPLTAMRSYYLFLAAKRASGQPIWSEPYIDDLGLGMITTVATPIYSPGSGDLDGVFLGVAGHDTVFSELGDTESETGEVILELVARSTKCTPSVTDKCQLQVLRNVYANKATCIDRFPIKSIPPSEPDAPRCFTNGRSFYKRYSSLVSWDEARDRCAEEGGALVSVGSPEELAFVANMASDDGTWIGARRQLDTFAWLDTSSPDLDYNSEAWGIGQPDSYQGVKDCVSIDTRGPSGNLNDASCEDKHTFICEYDSDDSCEGKILNPREKTKQYFNVPPINLCVNQEESLARVRPISSVANLNSSDVLCPLGIPRDDIEIQCCDECIPEKTETPLAPKDNERTNALSSDAPSKATSDSDDSDDSGVTVLTVVVILLGIVVVGLMVLVLFLFRVVYSQRPQPTPVPDAMPPKRVDVDERSGSTERAASELATLGATDEVDTPYP